MDQGRDTVSEGQSYALALALAVGDTATFDRVWRWTRTHLQRPDGLLAFHADPAGRVLDSSPATDADLVTAWVLLRRGGPARADGQRLLRAVVAQETVQVAGRVLLAAGPWATGQPATLNPSYWALPVLRDLAAQTADARWDALAADADLVLAAMPEPLPADWLRADGPAVHAGPAPDRSSPQAQYGPDAQRLLLWSAWSCRPDDRGVLRRALPALARGAGLALASRLDGRPLRLERTTLAQLAGGDRAGAARTARAYPTYYGDAWLALDEVHERLFPRCPRSS